MDHISTPKRRKIVDALVKATAAAQASPAFPTGPDANGRVVFLGDLQGARIGSFEWSGTFSGFTAADCTIQHSSDGTNWYTLKAFAQQASSPFVAAAIALLDTDPVPMRYVRALITMTGTPGTSMHTVTANFEQVSARGPLAPPGYVDR
jgi:hypothetical protein